jgi:hypothetical protein
MAVRFPKRQNIACGGGETGLHHQLYLDLNEIKDRESIRYLYRRIYQSLGAIGPTPDLWHSVEFPQISKFARGGGETGLQHQLYLDLNETKDTPCIGRYIRRIYQTLGGIEQTPGL